MGNCQRGLGSDLVFLFSAIALVVGAGCAKPSGEALIRDGEDSFQILNSESVGPRGAPHERAVLGVQMVNARGEVVGACSSVLIRPSVIMLTAHCFDPDLAPGLVAAVVHTTHDMNNATPRDVGVYRVVTPVLHPQYNSRQRIMNGVKYPFYDHDIALAVLDRPVDSAVATPQDFAAAQQGLTPGLAVVSYGYGRSIDWTDAKGTAAAKRFKTRQRGYLTISGKMLEDRNMTRADSKSFLCQGDSGGPAYLIEKTGRPVIVGLNSASGGKLLHALSGLRNCTGESVIQPIAPMRAWIDQKLMEIGKY